MKYLKPLGIMGLLGGSAALILIISVGDTFDFPGSAQYQTYEIFNRSMAVLLALQACSLLAFFIGHREALDKFNKRVLTIALTSWGAMAVGTAAEFWLYSDLPYPSSPADFNLRTLAFALFFFGSLIAGLALLILGIRLMNSSIVSRFFGTVMFLYLPGFIVLFFTGLSIFTAPALASIAIAGLTVRSKL